MTNPPVLNMAQVEKILGPLTDDRKVRFGGLIPLVSEQVLEYLNKDYLLFFNATATKDSHVLELKVDRAEKLKVGDIVEGPGLTEGADAPDIQAIDGGLVALSKPCSQSGDGIYFFRNLPPGAKIPVAQAIKFVASDAPDAGVSSKRIGPVSVNFGSGSQVGASGFPSYIEKGLLPYKRPRFK